MYPALDMHFTSLPHSGPLAAGITSKYPLIRILYSCGDDEDDYNDHISIPKIQECYLTRIDLSEFYFGCPVSLTSQIIHFLSTYKVSTYNIFSK